MTNADYAALSELALEMAGQDPTLPQGRAILGILAAGRNTVVWAVFQQQADELRAAGHNHLAERLEAFEDLWRAQGSPT